MALKTLNYSILNIKTVKKPHKNASSVLENKNFVPLINFLLLHYWSPFRTNEGR